MKKFGYIFVFVTVVLLVGVCWISFQSKPTSKNLQLSDSFDEDLEDARSFFKGLPQEQNYMFTQIGDYRYFEILNWTQGPVVGYRFVSKDSSLEFIVGNIDGSETTIFKIPDVIGFKEIEKTSGYIDEKGNILISSSGSEKSLQFTVGESNYIIDRKLTVWDVPQTK